jgi:TetR/AcrR family transcriptional regulator, regulator of cefoperazone and chloramphenicol sensitivity
MKDKLSRRDAILNSAYDILSKKGIINVTVYEIAEQANVNIAAINYYFGSKEKLVDMAIEKYIKEAFELFSILENGDETPKQKMNYFAQMIMDLTVYNFHRAMIFQAVGDDSIMPGILDSLKTHMDVAKRIISEFTGIKDEDTLVLKALRFYSNIFFPMLLVHYTPKATGLDLYKPEIRERYIEMMIENL